MAKQPEYAYLKQLQTTKNADWKRVSLAYDKWNYKQEGMTPAAAAVVVIVVTVLTYGYGAAAGGAAAGSGTAATTGTAATAGSATAGSTAAIGAAAAKAAIASIASQAAVSLINNKGNLDQTLKELGKSSTLKQAETFAKNSRI